MELVHTGKFGIQCYEDWAFDFAMPVADRVRGVNVLTSAPMLESEWFL